MNIRDALWILERTHTRDTDEPIGFTVEMSRIIGHEGGHSVAEYIEAWGVVRAHLRHGDGTCNVCGERLTLGCCNPAKAVVPVEQPNPPRRCYRAMRPCPEYGACDCEKGDAA